MNDEGYRDAGPAGSVPLEQSFDAGSLYALRAAVAAHAAAAGLSPQRVYDAVAAAHELAANSIVHGPGHGRLRLWVSDGFLYCQVSDDGRAQSAGTRGVAEAGVPWRAVHGHGLWVVERVADKVSVDRGRSGTTVTAGFAIAPA